MPYRGTELNIGVEDGPSSVATKRFAQHFTGSSTTVCRFPLPNAIQKNDYQKTLARISKSHAEQINASLSFDSTQIVVGGDHSVAFGSLLAVLTRLDPSRVGYLQFDSHGDIHLFKTSPSGNFHGMWLRPFVDDFDSPNFARLVLARLQPEQIMFIGNLELEAEEKRIFAAKKIVNIGSQGLKKSRQKALLKVRKFIEGFDHVHISFDIDVFDKKFVSATGTPAKNGLSPKEVFDVLEVVAPAKQKSIDMVEVNPRKENSRATIEIAQKVLLKLIGS